jgi:hypothetical protein
VPPDFQSNTKAGEIDDNEEFNTYLFYRDSFQRFLPDALVEHVDVTERHIIRVTSPDGSPVLGAEVNIYAGQERIVSLPTSAYGLAYFFPLAYSAARNTPDYLVEVVRDGEVESFQLTRDEHDMVWDVMLDVAPSPVQVDVLFLLDSTGSMGDEINELKSNILAVSAQLDALPGQPDIRYGLVTYRDRNDTYITQVTDFTGNVTDFQRTLDTVQAGGGGDYPESVNQALHEAVNDVSWRSGETIRLIFLIGDAPPHMDYPQDENYAVEMLNAADAGIKIHAVSSSGLDEVGEYVFRQIAQFTGGHFIFLLDEATPQQSGPDAGEPGTDHFVPDGTYRVEYLDELIIRLVTEEINALQD